MSPGRQQTKDMKSRAISGVGPLGPGSLSRDILVNALASQLGAECGASLVAEALRLFDKEKTGQLTWGEVFTWYLLKEAEDYAARQFTAQVFVFCEFNIYIYIYICMDVYMLDNIMS